MLAAGPAAERAAAFLSQERDWEPIRVPELLDAAALAGNLDRRTVLVVADAVRSSSALLVAIADAFAADAPHANLGFLHGRGEGELLDAARAIPPAAAAAADCGAPAPIALWVDADLQRDAEGLSLEQVAAGPNGLAQLARNPPELLILLGHSNGHDLGAAGAALCRRGSLQEHGADDLLRFPCHFGADCRFIGRPREEVNVDRLHARRVILLSCWGVSIAPSPFAVDASVGIGLLHHARVQTLITTVRSAEIGREDLLAFYYLARTGLPMGRLANAVNRRRQSLGQRAEFLCFGDPFGTLARTVGDASARETDARDAVTVALAPSDAAFDVCVQLPRAIAGERSIAIVERGARVRAAQLHDDHTLYVSAAPGDGAEAEISFAAAEDLHETAAPLTALSDDLAYATFALLTLRSPGPGDRPQALGAAFDALRSIVAGWPLRRLQPGAAVSRSKLHEPWVQLMRAIGDYQSAMIDLFVGTTQRGGTNFMKLADAYHFVEVEVPASEPCDYCGLPVSDALYKPIHGDVYRRTGYCQACGTVYEAPLDAVEPWIRLAGAAHSDVKPRRRFEITVQVANPFAFPVPSRAAAVIKHFNKDEHLPVSTPPIYLDARRPSGLQMTIDVPADYPAGVHFIDAIAFVGPRVAHLRRAIVVGDDALSVSVGPPRTPR